MLIHALTSTHRLVQYIVCVCVCAHLCFQSFPSPHTLIHIATDSDTLAPPLLFSCGVAAGLMASIITQPADVVKTSVQLRAASSADVGLVQTVLSICQRTGIRGMFAGITPRVTRRTLMAAFTWSFYEQVGIYPPSPTPSSVNSLSPRLLLPPLPSVVLRLLFKVPPPPPPPSPPPPPFSDCLAHGKQI